MKYLYTTDENYYDMPCIIHCENINQENSSVKFREQTLKTLQQNNKTRNKLGGENTHIQKCSNIPDAFNELVYHRECYQILLTQKPYLRILQLLDQQKELDCHQKLKTL